jgi:hypothetical protein
MDLAFLMKTGQANGAGTERPPVNGAPTSQGLFGNDGTEHDGRWNLVFGQKGRLPDGVAQMAPW